MKNSTLSAFTLVFSFTLHSLMAMEPTPRFYKITNKTSSPVQIYLTAAGYSYIAKGSKGNLAYDQTGRMDDPEGEFHTVQPNQTTTFTYSAGARMGFCVQAVMVKFPDQTDFIKAIQKNNDQKGCPNQNIILTREDENGNPSATGSAVATFNYTKPVDPTPVESQGPPPPADPNAPPPTTKESVLDKMKPQAALR